MELLCIGLGPFATYRYSTYIHKAISQGRLSHYHVIDCESQRQQVEARLTKVSTQPTTCTYIPNEILKNGPEAGVEWLEQQGIFSKSDTKLKVVIMTEPQAHDAYLKHALAHKFDVLVSKPLVLPMTDGLLDYRALMPNVTALAEASIEAGVNATVLCSGRHHEIYEKKLRQPIAMMMDRLQTPITSLHLKTASGVWNLPAEYGYREDHPYKYGYGMLMHGAYHYVDILARLLLMNKKLFPTEEFVLTLQGFTAGPVDQHKRIGNLDTKSSGYRPEFSELKDLPYGETDIVASYAMKFRSTGRVLCLGTIGLEQTTPGMRSWGPLPDEYNVNGRLHSSDIDVKLGTAFSMSVNLTKRLLLPRLSKTDARGFNYATITTRANAQIAGTQGYIRQENYERPWDSSYIYTAEADIFQRWMLDEPTYSDIPSHLPACAILEGLLKIAADDWSGEVEMEFNYPAPDYPMHSEKSDPWFTPMTDEHVLSPEPKPVNGKLGNGTLANGKVEAGTLDNDTLNNGTLDNGTLGNGTLGNGTLDNGILA